MHNWGPTMIAIIKLIFRVFLSEKSVSLIALVLLLTSVTTLHAKPHPLTYSAVTVRDREATIAAHTGIVTMLSGALDREVRIIVDRDNQSLVKDFIRGEVDIAYLGPLPFAVIYRNYPDLEVLVAVNEESGLAEYRCAMVSAYDGPISAGEVGGHIALTSPMSTCGYLSMAHIFATHGIDIEKLDYSFIGSHDQVALGVIRGHYTVGGVKDIVAEKYQGLLLQVLDSTPPLPGFVLVANRNTFSAAEMEQMRTTLLHAESADYQSWGVGNYGFSSAEYLDYGLIDTLMTPAFRSRFMEGKHDH